MSPTRLRYCAACTQSRLQSWRGWPQRGKPIPSLEPMSVAACSVCGSSEKISNQDIRWVNVHGVGNTGLPDQWRSRRTLENDFLQDRQMMKLGNFTGVPGIPNQDIVMWVSMGSRVDRSSDLLGASDLAIVEFRRLMSDAARRVAEGGAAIGTEEPRVPHVSISSKEGVYSKDQDWRTLGEESSQISAAE